MKSLALISFLVGLCLQCHAGELRVEKVYEEHDGVVTLDTIGLSKKDAPTDSNGVHMATNAVFRTYESSMTSAPVVSMESTPPGPLLLEGNYKPSTEYRDEQMNSFFVFASNVVLRTSYKPVVKKDGNQWVVTIDVQHHEEKRPFAGKAADSPHIVGGGSGGGQR